MGENASSQLIFFNNSIKLQSLPVLGAILPVILDRLIAMWVYLDVANKQNGLSSGQPIRGEKKS